MLSFFLTLVILERESLGDLISGSANIPFDHRHAADNNTPTQLSRKIAQLAYMRIGHE